MSDDENVTHVTGIPVVITTGKPPAQPSDEDTNEEKQHGTR